MTHVKKALTIAGSDSGGGAGIQADLKTFSALGVYGASVVAALTAQNTRGVDGILEVPAEFVALQIDSVLSDIGADAVKTGMLSSPEVVTTVAARLRRWRVQALVVDPVMVAKSGDALLRPEAREALVRELLPLAAVVTPNLPEAEVLTGLEVCDVAGMRRAAEALVGLGARAAIVKGGHLPGDEVVDVLLHAGRLVELSAPRCATRNTHGTGCTFASAVAAGLAHGLDLEAAFRLAKAYLSAALGRAFAVGGGHGPVSFFHGARDPEVVAAVHPWGA